MFFKKPILAIGLLSVAIFSCSKNGEDAPDSTVTPEECVQGRGASSGDTTGVYIVSYNRDAVNARTMSRGELNDLSTDLLGRHQISAAVLTTSFPGEPGGFIARLTNTQAQELREDASVAIVEQDRVISLSTCFTVVEPRLVTWNVDRTGYGNGIGKRAWIIDTGIDFDHPDLTVDRNASKSFISGTASAEDENGHGTHVGGIIGGKNNSIGVLGVASGATLISLRVLDKDGEGTISSIVQALAWVNTHASPGDVVNMSIGSDEGVSPTLDQQVRNTAARGIYIAIAAGNEHKLANLSSPARVNGTNIYTVSAIDSSGNFASFSNYGNDVVDYAMPGVKILSTFTNGRYAYMSGTSMAAPHMAGILLLRGNNFTTRGTAGNDPDGTADAIAHY